jgi:hypothetical protein
MLRVIHVAYGLSFDSQAVVAAFVDEHGEMLTASAVPFTVCR